MAHCVLQFMLSSFSLARLRLIILSNRLSKPSHFLQQLLLCALIPIPLGYFNNSLFWKNWRPHSTCALTLCNTGAGSLTQSRVLTANLGLQEHVPPFVWHNNCGSLLGNEFNSPVRAQRSQVGQSLWCHCDFMSVHVSFTSIHHSPAPPGQVSPAGGMPSLSTNSFPANTGVGPGKNHLTSPCGLYSSASEKLGLGKGTGTGFLFSAGY